MEIETGTKVYGKTLSGRTVKGTVSYVNFNPIVTDKDGNKWLVDRKSLSRVDYLNVK